MDAKNTAVIHIDLMNALMGMPLKPYSAADVIGRCAQLSGKLRAAGGTVVYVRVEMREFKPHQADAPMSIDIGSLPA
ncbi:MAG: isochorismatase family protein, partial [Candidatus Xenobia bacterium]